MTRFYCLAACSSVLLLLLPPLVFACGFPLTCSAGFCTVTPADLTAEQVALELGPQLSDSSGIFGPRDPRWEKTTRRYDPYMQPRFHVVVQPGRESDIPKIVSITITACLANSR